MFDADDERPVPWNALGLGLAVPDDRERPCFGCRSGGRQSEDGEEYEAEGCELQWTSDYGSATARPPARRRVTIGQVRYQFVDCRWDLAGPELGREVYLEGHIPGATFLDVDEDLSDLSVEGEGRHPLPSAERFAAAAGRAGIGEGVFVVAYGTMGGAERLWWLLRHFGHDACAVLDGGIDAWLGPLSADDEAVEPAVFALRERSGDTIDVQELTRRLDDPSLVLVDARLPPRWRGEQNPIDKVPGRIPGAFNAPWNEALRELPDGEIVAYCGSGVTSSVTVHRLALTGRQARLYPGSWSQWETLDLPVERSSVGS